MLNPGFAIVKLHVYGLDIQHTKPTTRLFNKINRFIENIIMGIYFNNKKDNQKFKHCGKY